MLRPAHMPHQLKRLLTACTSQQKLLLQRSLSAWCASEFPDYRLDRPACEEHEAWFPLRACRVSATCLGLVHVTASALSPCIHSPCRGLFSFSLGVRIAQGESCSYALGPQVDMLYTLSPMGLGRPDSEARRSRVPGRCPSPGCEKLSP